MIFSQLQIDPGWLSAAMALLLCLAGVVLLLRCRIGLEGTTLLAPWAWGMLAWVSLCGTEITLGVLNELHWEVSEGQWRYLAAMTLFCPQISQIGAKRPQNRLWQGLVGLFWLVLCLPVAQAWFFGFSGHIDPGWFWKAFLGGLILAGLLNNGPTRFGPTAVCLAGAQGLMCYPYLPWVPAEVTSGGALLTMGILLLGIGLIALGWPGRMEVVRAEDRAWLDFRDSFGSFWAVRVMFRVNDAAVRYDWGLWLGWNGFAQVEIAGSLPEFRDELRQGLVTCLRNLFGKFVDEAWLDARLPRPTKRKTGLEDLEA